MLFGLVSVCVCVCVWEGGSVNEQQEREGARLLGATLALSDRRLCRGPVYSCAGCALPKDATS